MKLGEKDTSIGFTNVSDGWHGFEVDENIGYLEDKEEGTSTDTFQIPCTVLDDEDEGARCSIFCPLDKKFGRTKLAKVLGYTGLAKIMEKTRKLNADLDPVQWGEKYLQADDPKCQKVINDIQAKLPGRKFRGEVKSVTVKAKKKDEKDKEYTNIINLGYYEEGKSGKGGTTEGEGVVDPEVVNEKSEKDDDWG